MPKDSSASTYLYFSNNNGFDTSTGESKLNDGESNTSIISSGVKGIGIGNGLLAGSYDTIKNPYKVEILGTGGTVKTEDTFYTYDNVLNVSSAGLTITYTLDSTDPTISNVTTGTTNCYDAGTSSGEKTIYFNKKDHPVTSLVLEVTASDNAGGSDIKSYSCTVGSNVPVVQYVKDDSANANKFTIDTDSISSSTTVTIKATDYVNNDSDEYKITLIPDSAAPTLTPTFKNGDNSIDAKYISGSLEHSGKVYFNADTGKITSPKIEFSGSDGVVGEVSGVDGTVSVNYEYTPAETSVSQGISTTDKTETKVTAKVKDNVGNESTFVVTFIADKTPPTIAHDSIKFFKNTTPDALESNYYYHHDTTNNIFYFNSNNSRQAYPVFNSSDVAGGAGLDNVYIREATGDTTLAKVEEGSETKYYYVPASYDNKFTFVAIDKVGNEAVLEMTIKPDTGKPTIGTPKLESGAVGVYLNESENKVYYNGNNTNRTGKLSFTANDGENESGLSVVNGFLYSTVQNLQGLAYRPTLFSEYILNTSSPTETNKNIVTLTEGSHYFYTVDNVGNVSDSAPSDDDIDGYKLTFEKDITPPTTPTVSVEVTGDDGIEDGKGYHFDISTNYLYINTTNTFNKKVTGIKITINSADTDGSGIASYSYTLDMDSTEVKKVSVNGDDAKVYEFTGIDNTFTEKTLKIKVTDNVGNNSDEITLIIALDGTTPAPTVSEVQNGDTAITANIFGDLTSGSTLYYNSNTYTTGLKLLFQSSENVSGLYGIYRKSDNSKLTDNLSDVITNGEFKVYAKDMVGNVSDDFTITLSPDGTKPTITTPTLASGANGFYLKGNKIYYNNDNDRSASLSFTLEDKAGDSGVKEIESEKVFFVSTDSNLTSIPESPVYYKNSFPLNSSETVTKYFYTVDNVGNVSEVASGAAGYKLEFEIDITQPEVSVTPTETSCTEGNGFHFEDGNFYFNDSVKDITLTVTATDASDIASYSLKLDDTHVVNKDTATDANANKFGMDDLETLGIIADGATDISELDRKTLTIIVTDNVGNANTSTTVTFTKDTSKPVFEAPTTNITADYISEPLTSSFNEKTIYFNSNKVSAPTITFTAKDGIEDAHVDTVLKNEAGDVLTCIATADGAKTIITVTAKDKVGNEETYTLALIAVNQATQLTAPVVSAVSETSRFPADISGWNGSDGCFFKGSSATVTFEHSASTGITKAGLRGIYKWKTDTDPASIDGDAFTDNGIEISEPTTLKVVAVDKVGNISAPFTITISPDTTGPEINAAAATVDDTSSANKVHLVSTTCYYNPTEKETPAVPSDPEIIKSISFAIAVDSNITDGGSGVNGIAYIQTYSSTAPTATSSTATDISGNTLTITPSGATEYIYFYGVDNVGNYSATSIWFKLEPDGTKPDMPTVSEVQNSSGITVTENIYGKLPAASTETDWKKASGSTLYFNSATSYYTDGIKLLFESNDTGGSGIKGIYLSDDTKLIDKISSVITTSTTLTVYAMDFVGNKSDSFEITITPDDAAPSFDPANFVAPTATGTGYFISGDNFYYNSTLFTDSATFRVTDVNDGVSGIKEYYYTINDTNRGSSTYNGTFSVSLLDNTNDNGKIIAFYVVDNVGNPAVIKSYTLVLDTTAPAIKDASEGEYAYNETENWYVLNTIDGDNFVPTMALYGTVSLPGRTEDGFYKFVYGTSADDTPEDMTSYTSGTDIPLPNYITTSDNSYLFLWLKDKVGNASSTKILYKVGDKSLPIGKYEQLTGFNYELSADKKTITISNYPKYAGLKSIKISGVANGGSCNDILVSSVQPVEGTDYITIEPSATMLIDTVIISLENAEDSITSVSIIDAANNTVPGTLVTSGSDPDPGAGNILSHFATTDTAPSVISTVSHIISRVVKFIPDDTADEITVPRARKPRKTSAKSAKKSSSKKSSAKAKSSASAALPVTVPATPIATDVSEILDTPAQNVPESAVETIVAEIADTAHIAGIADVIDQVLEDIVDIPEIVEDVGDLVIENNSDKVLAENKISDYNMNDELFVESDSSKVAIAVVATAITVLTGIVLVIALLLKRKRMNK